MSKWYGSIDNRLEEGKNFTGREIRVGDDITMYLWSDRMCYYVTDVENQKRIKVRRYYHCADHSKPGGMGHQNWLLFKTWDEYNEYLADYFPQYHCHGEHRDEPDPETWVFRYNKWMVETICKDSRFCNNERERKEFEKKGYFRSYRDTTGKVSFGVAEYYHDWEF